MRKIKNIYPKLCDREFIKQTIILASRGKRKRRQVRKVLAHLDEYATKIQEMMINGTYFLQPSHHKTIHERGKDRELTISPFFPNRILDYLLVEALKPYIRKSMYEFCIGNVDGRGMVYGKKVIERKYKKYKYYVKLDIRRFYPSVDSERMAQTIEKRVGDKKFTDFARFIVKSCPDLPIGSYYSQWFSNWYLEKLDHAIKEKYRVPFYVRYVDDMLLMGNNRRALMRAEYAIEKELHEMGLALKRHEYPRTVADRPIDFLGFRFTERGVILRVRNFKVLNRRYKNVRKTHRVTLSQAQSLLSYVGWLKQTRLGYIYYINHLRGTARNGQLRKIVSSSAKGTKCNHSINSRTA